jgi:hypothetical protein
MILQSTRAWINLDIKGWVCAYDITRHPHRGHHYLGGSGGDLLRRAHSPPSPNRYEYLADLDSCLLGRPHLLVEGIASPIGRGYSVYRVGSEE